MTAVQNDLRFIVIRPTSEGPERDPGVMIRPGGSGEYILSNHRHESPNRAACGGSFFSTTMTTRRRTKTSSEGEGPWCHQTRKWCEPTCSRVGNAYPAEKEYKLVSKDPKGQDSHVRAVLVWPSMAEQIKMTTAEAKVFAKQRKNKAGKDGQLPTLKEGQDFAASFAEVKSGKPSAGYDVPGCECTACWLPVFEGRVVCVGGKVPLGWEYGYNGSTSNSYEEILKPKCVSGKTEEPPWSKSQLARNQEYKHHGPVGVYGPVLIVLERGYRCKCPAGVATPLGDPRCVPPKGGGPGHPKGAAFLQQEMNNVTGVVHPSRKNTTSKNQNFSTHSVPDESYKNYLGEQSSSSLSVTEYYDLDLTNSTGVWRGAAYIDRKDGRLKFDATVNTKGEACVECTRDGYSMSEYFTCDPECTCFDGAPATKYGDLSKILQCKIPDSEV